MDILVRAHPHTEEYLDGVIHDSATDLTPDQYNDVSPSTESIFVFVSSLLSLLGEREH